MQNLAFLRRLLPYAHGVPSHDTLGDVVAMLDPALFKACFTRWATGLHAQASELADPEVIASDGKTSRRSHARAGTGSGGGQVQQALAPSGKGS